MSNLPFVERPSGRPSTNQKCDDMEAALRLMGMNRPFETSLGMEKAAA